MPTPTYSRFSCDVTAVYRTIVNNSSCDLMFVYRTIVKKFLWEFDSIIMQNLRDILPLFCMPIWPSLHVNENQKYTENLSILVPTIHRQSKDVYWGALITLLKTP